MNECIRRRELTMTVVCKSCENQYGAWRPRCPACGTSTPITIREEQHRARRAPATPRTSATACVFCRCRGAKVRCSICNELAHGTCMGVHKVECEQYQRDVAAETARLAGENHA